MGPQILLITPISLLKLRYLIVMLLANPMQVEKILRICVEHSTQNAERRNLDEVFSSPVPICTVPDPDGTRDLVPGLHQILTSNKQLLAIVKTYIIQMITHS